MPGVLAKPRSEILNCFDVALPFRASDYRIYSMFHPIDTMLLRSLVMQPARGDGMVLVQWIGPGKRSAPSAGEPVPVTVATTSAPTPDSLVFVHEDRDDANAACDRVVQGCAKTLKRATIVEVVLGKIADVDDPRACRAAILAGGTVHRWAPRSRDKSTQPMLDPLASVIPLLHAQRVPVRWALSAATGTASIVATLLSELADALADAVDRRVIASAQLDCLRWDNVESRAGERRLQPIESINAKRDLVGRSRRVRERVLKWSPIGVPVLLTGPTGAGKTTIAEQLHRLWWPNERRDPLRINCSLLEPELAAAELFGAKKGAFTGATRDREGVFGEAATQPSTIFLDEFAELPAGTQAKLLTAIEPSMSGSRRVHRFTPVGSAKEQEIDVEKLRLVLATNRVIDGEDSVLREDLVARISQVVVRVAPLRETPASIPASVLEAIEQLNTATPPLGLADVGALPLLLDATTDEQRPWRFNYRDVRRFAIELVMAARTERKPRSMRKRVAIESEHVRSALARTAERRQSDTTEAPPRTGSDPWTLDLGALPSQAIANAMAAMPLSKRYQALLLVRAWQECDRNAAAAWRLLFERRALEPGRSADVARNESSAFAQRWQTLFGKSVRLP